jgi:pimeloyl-ACP methyl ester carboxylesterase
MVASMTRPRIRPGTQFAGAYAAARGILLPMTTTPHPLTLPDGRALEVLVAGPQGAPLVVNLHGTPSGHDLAVGVQQAAAQAGLRIASIARPGYAGSTRLPGRSVADVVPDVLAVVDALGADRFAVMGTSGGGPHALACGALAPDRCAAVASVSGVGPWAAEGLDFLAGMGEGNEVEFGAALEGEAPLRELLVPWREEMVSAGPQGTFLAMQSVLSAPDQKVFTGEVAAHLHEGVSLALRDGVDGWIDDDLAFTRPWGFTPAEVSVPVFLWQGQQDLMVPPEHGRWLAARLPDCRARLLPDDGHLTLLVNRPGEVLADLARALGQSA